MSSHVTFEKPNKTMKFTQGLQKWRMYYTQRSTFPQQDQKRLSHRLVQTPLQDFHRAAGVMEWCSDKSQTTAALLMLRNEVPQGPVSIYLGDRMILRCEAVTPRVWPRLFSAKFDLGSKIHIGLDRGKLPGIVLLKEISFGETGEIILLSWWSSVISGQASSLAAISDPLSAKHRIHRK